MYVRVRGNTRIENYGVDDLYKWFACNRFREQRPKISLCFYINVCSGRAEVKAISRKTRITSWQ